MAGWYYMYRLKHVRRPGPEAWRLQIEAWGLRPEAWSPGPGA
jgi:hypothetical protein